MIKSIETIYNEVHRIENFLSEDYVKLNNLISKEIRKKHTEKICCFLKYLRGILKVKYREFIDAELLAMGIQSDEKYLNYVRFQIRKIAPFITEMNSFPESNIVRFINSEIVCFKITVSDVEYDIYTNLSTLKNKEVSPLSREIISSNEFERKIFKSQSLTSNQLLLV